MEGARDAEAFTPDAATAVRAAAVCHGVVAARVDRAIRYGKQVLTCGNFTRLRNSQPWGVDRGGGKNKVASLTSPSNGIHDNSFSLRLRIRVRVNKILESLGRSHDAGRSSSRGREPLSCSTCK